MEHGTFSVDHDARTVSGVLIPWGEKSRTSASKTKPITFARGSVTIPRDPAVVGLNVAHDRFSPIGRATLVEDADSGLVASFTIADTPEGDAWLADRGEFVKLSAEVRDMTRDADDNGTAVLTGAALVTEGAFASAALFAIDSDTDEDEEETTDEAPAPTEEEPDAEPDEDESEDAVAEATATGATFGRGTTTKPKEQRLTRGELFAAIESVAKGDATGEQLRMARTALDVSSGLFALEDITYNDTGDLVTYLPKQWLGEVEDGTQYTPIFAPLFGQQSLTSLAMTGWKWGNKPVGGTWTGNKTEIPSDPVTFTQVNENATRWANGNDIAREHRDFGTPGFFEAFDRLNREAFYRWLDNTIVLTEALAGATDVEADNPAGLSIGAGWSALIDGAASIVAAGLKPTGAVVDLALWKSMLKTPNSDVLGYLSAAIGLERGELDGFQIEPHEFTGGSDGHILVVAKSAADVYTLPGSPIRAEALNISLGGVDVGYFGYGGLLIKNAAGIVDVAPYTP